MRPTYYTLELIEHILNVSKGPLKQGLTVLQTALRVYL